MLRIASSLPAQGHLCHAGAPGLVLIFSVNCLTGQRLVHGSAVKVFTRRGVDEENTTLASTFLCIPLIPTMTNLSDLTVPAEWLAHGVRRVSKIGPDGLVNVTRTFQRAPANAAGRPSPYDRTDPFPRSHSNQCGSSRSKCPVATSESCGLLEGMHASDVIQVALQPTREPEVEATGESKRRRYAVLQSGVGYKVLLLGRESWEWAVREVILLWSAAGSIAESDQRRLKRWSLYSGW